MLTWIYPLYQWLILVPLILLLTLVFAIIAIVLALTVGPSRSGQFAGPTWARCIAALTPVRVSVRGREHLDPNQSYVFVANHRSMYDIIVLYGWLGMDFRWVMKKELRKVPALGIACAVLGHVFVDRSNRDAARAALNDVRDQLRGGTCILFFPEGTRSSGPKLLPFKTGAFRMAESLELPVVPLTLNGTAKIIPNKTVNIHPGQVSLTIHPPLPVGSHRETLKQARTMINDTFVFDD